MMAPPLDVLLQIQLAMIQGLNLKKMKAKEMVMTEAELLEPGKGSC